MTVNAARYAPLFPSEQLLRGFAGQPPFKGCGLSTILVDAAWGTLGECQIKPNGRPFGRDDFTDQLKVGWRAFERVHDSNGIPDRDDYARIHRAMLPGLPVPDPLVSRDFDEVVELLKVGERGWAISIAVFLAALPDGALLKKFAGNAPHQIPLVNADGEVKRGKARCQDAMHPPQLNWAGHDVPLAQVEKAAKAFPDSRGLVLAWKVPIGGWTQEALATEGLRDRVRELRGENDSLTARVDSKNLVIAEQRTRISQLEAAGGVDVDAARAAAWTGALEAMKRDADRHIGDGPPEIGGQ